MKSKAKKKGFTLIELIATIVILGMLLLIAIPNISKIIETSNKNSYLDATKMAVNAVMSEADLAKAGDEDEQFHFNDSNYCIYNFSQLEYSSGKLDGSGYVRVQNNGGNYLYYVSASNGKYQINDVSFSNLSIDSVADATIAADALASFESNWNCLSTSTETTPADTPVSPADQEIIERWTVYHVVFKAEDGSFSDTTADVVQGNPIPYFRPTPPSGKEFKNWKTASGDYTESNPVESDLTLFAVWQPASGGGSSGNSKCNQYDVVSFPNNDGGNEEFFVVDGGKSSNKLVLLAKNGLVGDTTVRQAYSGTSTSGYLAGNSMTKANADTAKNNYKTYLQSMGLSVDSVDFFTQAKLSNLCSNIGSNYSYSTGYYDISCGEASQEILKFDTYYWTEMLTASGSDTIVLTSDVRFRTNQRNAAVRPVVTLVRSSVAQCN